MCPAAAQSPILSFMLAAGHHTFSFLLPLCVIFVVSRIYRNLIRHWYSTTNKQQLPLTSRSPHKQWLFYLRSWTFAQLSARSPDGVTWREHQTYRGWWWAFIWCYLLRFSGKTFYYTSAILPIWKEGVIAAWSLPLCLMIRIKSSDIYVQKWNTSISAFDQDFLARLSYKYLGHIIPFIVCLTGKKEMEIWNMKNCIRFQMVLQEIHEW